MALKQKQNNSSLPIIVTILVIILIAAGLYVWFTPSDSVSNPGANTYNNNSQVLVLNGSDVLDLIKTANANNSNNAANTNTSAANNATLPANVRIAATFKEGDLIQLKQNIATSPDGSKINYSYSKPLDESGRWQTQIGDAGVYAITITANDGRLKTIRTIGIEVKAVNRAPVITSFENINVKEGDKVELRPVISDYEKDSISLSYSGWMKSDTYQTNYDDAGVYSVTLFASDALHTVNKTATVTVTNVNRQPTLEPISTITVEEEQRVVAKPVYYDSDKGQQLTVSFTKPLDANGVWTPKIGDAGKYDVTVSVNDGEATASQPLKIVVTQKNLAPVVTKFADVSVDENTTLVLAPVVTDPNGDNVTVTYSGWMNSTTRNIAFGDAGNHSVTLTATDGKLTASKTITVSVNKVYRAPVFVDDSQLFVK